MSDPSPSAATPSNLASASSTPRAVSAAAAIHALRRIGKMEAVSFLILLGIAMPLKYIAHWPLAVKIVGWAHGLLFVIFLITLARAKKAARLTLQQSAIILAAALLPFGPFIIDRRLERQAARRAPGI